MSLNVSKDSKGFDDIDKFWKAVDTEVQESNESSDDDFAYDTSSTISESSNDSEEEEEEEKSGLSVTHSSPEETANKSLESNLSASLSLHENEEDEEDTDAQEGSTASSEEEVEEEEELITRGKEKVLESSLSSGHKKNKTPASRRQSKVQFDDETPSQQSRRRSAPAALPSSASSSSKKKPKKTSVDKEQSQVIDESSPFFVEGRISEIPQVSGHGHEDSEQSPQLMEDDDYYDNNDAPFDDDTRDEAEEEVNVGSSDLRTPSSTRRGVRDSDDDDDGDGEGGSDSGQEQGSTDSKGKKSNSSKTKSKYQYFDTPGGTPASRQSTPGDFVRGRDLPDESYREGEGEEEESDGEGLTDTAADTTMDQSLVDTTYMQAIRDGALEHNTDSEPEVEEEVEEGGPRRSRRATKGQRVQFWKNERPRYKKGRMVGILKAAPTPVKPRTTQQKKKKKNNSKQSKRLFDGHSSDESSDGGHDARRRKKAKAAPFPSSRLPSDVTFISRKKVDTFSVWDDVVTAPTNTTVIHLNEAAHPPTQLPITAVRPEGKDVVGVAAQSFNVPEIPKKMSGWISGFCELPPGGIKDAEGVGECCQVFQVASCQDGSVEFGLAHPSEEEWVDQLAQRTVLKSRDSFYVPPGNIYRLENHSTVEPCVIYWTIIRPLDEQEDEAVGGTA